MTEHVFISYSTRDRAFVEQLRADLRTRGISAWIDHQNLVAGTHNWDNAIRGAIENAFDVLLIATPHARRSPYVQDELAIAKMYQRRIIPVWSDGQHYIDCVPMGLGHIQHIDARGEQYAIALDALVRTLSGVTPPPQPITSGEPALEPTPTPEPPPELPKPPPPAEPRNPYKGLEAFREQDAGDFFGRDALIEELIAALHFEPGQARFLAVIGASGSGKSSVVMAGLLPRLRAGAIKGSADWRYLDPMVPGTHPIENLTIALTDVVPYTPLDIKRQLDDPDDRRGLHLLAKQAAKSGRLVLYIDQFEELFTLTASEDERRRFIDLLIKAVTEPDGALLVIVSLRADFFDRPLEYNVLGGLFKEQHVSVLPMTLSDLYDVVHQPAALPDVQVQFEAGLDTDILFAVRDEAGSLPLLQFTLDQLFQRREGHLLTRASYEELGGVRGALTQHAEETYEHLLSDSHRELARALFLRLIEPGATEQDTTRRRANWGELTLDDVERTKQYRETANAFVHARLLVADEDTLEVSHEALIREWGRLGTWLHEAREDLRLQKKINADAADWVRAGRPARYGGFYSGTLLVDALNWCERNVAAADETAFVQASRAADEQRKAEEAAIARRVQNFRRASLGLGVMVVLAIVAGVLTGLTAVTARSDSAAAQTAQAQANAEGATARSDQGTAVAQANVAAAQAAQAENLAVTATIAQGLAQIDANNAGTQAAEVRSLAATATVAQGLSLAEADNAATQAAQAERLAFTATVAQGRALADANIAGTQAAEARNLAMTATIAQGQAVEDAQNAATQAAAATIAQGEALNLGGTAEAGSTQLAADAAYFALQQQRVGILAAGAVVVPPGSGTPEPTQYVATLTQIAVMNAWQPHMITDDFGVEMVEVPPGCFLMGSVAGGDEQPIHEQCFSESFYIDRYEVTNAQYVEIAGSAPPSEFSEDLLPVNNINWFDARDFCRLRGAELPTEAQWEYAARGPDSLTYPWGNEFVAENAVYSRPSSAGPLAVMDKEGQPLRPAGASWVGAVDLAGNVYEWTSTRYDDLDYGEQLFDFQGLYPYPYAADDGRESDETVEEYEARLPMYTLRVLRGGSFILSDTVLRGAARNWSLAGGADPTWGFRCARS